MIGSVRHEIRIRRSADDVWALAGDPARLHEWFPSITSSAVEGTSRVITTRAGLSMPEEILVNDPLQRRFQYRVAAPVFVHHRGTIDVIDLGDGTCLAIYGTEADPRTMAIVIGAASREALEELRRRLELDPVAEES